MTERDKRWEKVVAYIGEPFINNYSKPGVYIDFEIEVRHDDQLFTTRQRVERTDWEKTLDKEPEIFAGLLEKMIEFTDRHINHWDEHHKHLSWTE